MSKANIIVVDGQEKVEVDYAPPLGLGLHLPETRVMAYDSLATKVPLLSFDEIKRIVTSDDWAFGQKMFDSSFITYQNGYGSCFPAGTLVRMADGTVKPIQDIRVLDEVVSAEGNPQKVLCVQVRDCKEKSIVKLNLWGHRHLKATAEHPVLTKSGYKPIGELTEDDWVAVPRYMPVTTEAIVPEEYSEKPWRMLKEATESRRGIQGKKQVIIKRTPCPAAIKLDYSFGRIVGLFLAEGNTDHGKVVFSLSAPEYDTLGLELEQRFMELFGVTASRVIRNNKTIVRVYGANWVEMFQGLCATGSGSKRLHSDLLSGPKEFLRGVFEGWEDGDGNGPGKRGGTTISHELAMNMFDIANFLGYMPTIRTSQPKLSHGVKSRQRRYDVHMTEKAEAESQPRSWRCLQEDDVVWRKVQGIVHEPFAGHVFNLEVENDHSYIAESIGVHNCAAYAVSGAGTKTRVQQGFPRIDLSGDYMYSLVNDNRDRGAGLQEVMNAMMTRGCATRELVKLGDIYRNKYNTDVADKQALRFRGHEMFATPDEQSLATALALKMQVIIAIHVTRRWREFDADDVLAECNGMGNHCEHLDDIRWNAKKGRLEYRKATSHGKDYSGDGYCWTAWDLHYKTTSRYHMFYTCPSLIVDPEIDLYNMDGSGPSPSPSPDPVPSELSITMATRDNCGHCSRWKSEVAPLATQAGWKIDYENGAGGAVPRFKINVKGNIIERTGFISWQELQNLNTVR